MNKTPFTPTPSESVQVKIWLSPDTLKSIDDYAELHGRSRSWVIDRAIAQWYQGVERCRKNRRRKARSDRRAA